MKRNCVKCGKLYVIEDNDDCKIHKKYFCCGCYIDLGAGSNVAVPNHIPSTQVYEYITERYYKKYFV